MDACPTESGLDSSQHLWCLGFPVCHGSSADIQIVGSNLNGGRATHYIVVRKFSPGVINDEDAALSI